MVLQDCLSWTRTKLNSFVSKVIIPRLEVLLVWYLKYSGQRNVEKYWRKQLSSLSDRRKQDLPADPVIFAHMAESHFDICVATARDHRSHVHEISSVINAAYVRELKSALLDGNGAAQEAFSRTTPSDILRRLLSDDELQRLRDPSAQTIINRVLFLAVAKDKTIIGTCAATLAAPWCPLGVGSWGLLAVKTPKSGVGRRLVEHCEQYLRTAMLEGIRIEYFFISGHPSSESLRQWYEDRLKYVCFKAPSTGRSYRGNEVRGEVRFRHCDKDLNIAGDLDKERALVSDQAAVFQARRRRLANFLLLGARD